MFLFAISHRKKTKTDDNCDEFSLQGFCYCMYLLFFFIWLVIYCVLSVFVYSTMLLILGTIRL